MPRNNVLMGRVPEVCQEVCQAECPCYSKYFPFCLAAYENTVMHEIYLVIIKLAQPTLVFAIARTNMSVAPTSVSLSMTVAICFFSTIELTATQPSSSKALMVGARLPGVIFVADWSFERWTLYWQRTYF